MYIHKRCSSFDEATKIVNDIERMLVIHSIEHVELRRCWDSETGSGWAFDAYLTYHRRHNLEDLNEILKKTGSYIIYEPHDRTGKIEEGMKYYE